MGLSEGFFRKKVLGQLKGGMKLLILTVLIYPGRICTGYTHKNPTCYEPVVGLLWSLQIPKVWENQSPEILT